MSVATTMKAVEYECADCGERVRPNGIGALPDFCPEDSCRCECNCPAQWRKVTR